MAIKKGRAFTVKYLPINQVIQVINKRLGKVWNIDLSELIRTVSLPLIFPNYLRDQIFNMIRENK